MSDPGAISALEPAGTQAEQIRRLFDGYLGVSILVFILVMGALVVGLRRERREDEPPHEESPPDVMKRKARVVGSATAVTVVTLVVLLVMSVVTGRALASLTPRDALAIEITGHRWWWDVKYPDAISSNAVRTAYEIHVPLGRPVELRLVSHDVIHSFWVPSLGPKRDLIPGKPSTLVLRADRPGTFDGLCAEYCGLQHANMRLRVVVEPEREFQAWLTQMRAPAREPQTEREEHGRSVFLAGRCVACHAIVGTTAFAAVGPDLTHVGSRSAIAMGTLPNDVRSIRSWIEDPQHAKAGVIMPEGGISDGDLDDLALYLSSLR